MIATNPPFPSVEDNTRSRSPESPDAAKEGKIEKPQRETLGWPEDPAWSLERLWAEGAKPVRWIVEPLIAEGHQVILAAEPKAGKSLLASQLCLEIAKGEPNRLLQISLPRLSPALKKGEKLPEGAFRIAQKDGQKMKADKSKGENVADLPLKQNWVVLYVSFEMNPETMWARTSQQAFGMGTSLLLKGKTVSAPKLDAMPPPKYIPGTYPSAHGFYHLFELNGQQDLALIPKYRTTGMLPEVISESKGLQKRLREVLEMLQPDLIIFDSLSKLHWCDENSNVEMRDVLQSLRRLCRVPIGAKSKSDKKDERPTRPVAHIIIHHTRKDTGDSKYSRKDASEMRGASAIHAEADLAITITKRKPNGDEISLSFSSRHSARLSDLRLSRHNDHGTYTGQLPPEQTTLVIARRLFAILHGRGHLKVEEILRYYKTEKLKRKFSEPELEKSSWEKMLNRLHRIGSLLKIKGRRGKPSTYSLRRTLKEKDWEKFVVLAEGKGKSIAQKVGKSP